MTPTRRRGERRPLLTVSYGNTNGSPLEYPDRLAGRQRMLSQRLASFTSTAPGAVRGPADMEMHLSRAHFTSVLTQLETRPCGPAARAAAISLRRAWERYPAGAVCQQGTDRHARRR